jgi:hypothetical protein
VCRMGSMIVLAARQSIAVQYHKPAIRACAHQRA